MEEAANYADDSDIEDDAVLWRRVPPFWVVRDENRGEFRPSSAAFQDSSDGSAMSVQIEKIVNSMQRTPADVLTGYENHSLCSFVAGLARSLEQRVTGLPKIDDDPAHGWVAGKKTKHVRKVFATEARWVVLHSPTS
jgi:hypothetical protein